MIIKLGAVAEWALIIVWTSHRLREKLQKGKRWVLKLKIISNTVLRPPFVSTINGLSLFSIQIEPITPSLPWASSVTSPLPLEQLLAQVDPTSGEHFPTSSGEFFSRQGQRIFLKVFNTG